tara:strand:- start:764 stop:1543 length:780 start_codon:yes stop_codon:yes gene_type:complete
MSKDMMFSGFVSDETTNSTSIKFGLNQKAKLTKFEYNPAIEFKSGDTGEGIEAEIKLESGLDLKMNIYPTTKVYVDGNEVTDTAHPAFRKGVTILKQRLFHIAKCFSSEEDLIKAVAIPKNFGDFVNSIVGTFEKGWQEKELDLFMQYQWQLKEGAERKYLEIPKKTSQGAFLVPHIEGQFCEVKVNDGIAYAEGIQFGEVSGKKLTVEDTVIVLPKKDTALVYLNDDNTLHPFSRGTWFMENGWGQSDDGAEDNLSAW